MLQLEAYQPQKFAHVIIWVHTMETTVVQYTQVHTYTVHFPLCPNNNEQVYNIIEIKMQR